MLSVLIINYAINLMTDSLPEPSAHYPKLDDGPGGFRSFPGNLVLHFSATKLLKLTLQLFIVLVEE